MPPIILLSAAGLFVAFLAFVATRTPDFRITRSVSIAAPPESMFVLVNDFRAWERWSPWAKIDTTMTEIREGAASGTGAIHKWSGTGKAGTGQMTILESRPPEEVRIELKFEKPFKATNATLFTFRPEGSGTRVEWSMSGTNNFMAKAAHVLMNIDKLVGKDFEKGLIDMKSAAETDATRG